MNSETGTEQIVPVAGVPAYSVPWKFVDNWIGVALLAVIDVVIFIIMLGQERRADLAQSAAVLLLELAYLLPVIFIFAWRRVHWRHLRFGKFEWSALGIGCGLLIGSYVIIILHNALLFLLGVDTQGENIVKLFARAFHLFSYFFSFDRSLPARSRTSRCSGKEVHQHIIQHKRDHERNEPRVDIERVE